MTLVATLPHLPVLRFGEPYRSLDCQGLTAAASGDSIGHVSLANAGIPRRDLRQRAAAAAATLRAMSIAARLAACQAAAEHYLHADLPLGVDGERQSPADYRRQLAATTGLPDTLVRANMAKLADALGRLPAILRSLTRGLPLELLDGGVGQHAGVAMNYLPVTDVLGVVLPSNSPGVNSLWLPAIALGVPVALKPGRNDPWTPYRLIQAMIVAGLPAAAFGFYPTDHEGADALLQGCGRSILFGDRSVTDRYAADPRVECHGPGYSKVYLGPDLLPDWQTHLDVVVESIAGNGGRSCVNASAVVVGTAPAAASSPSSSAAASPAPAIDAFADALARRLAAIVPRPPEHPEAGLAAFTTPAVAEWIDAAIEADLAVPGAVDLCAAYRQGSRLLQLDGLTYLQPTLIRCATPEHPLANREFLFPYAAIWSAPADATLAARLGPTLALTALTHQPAVLDACLASPAIDRLNLGPIPTGRVDWEQPHEGNLFEFLYRRRAYNRAW